MSTRANQQLGQMGTLEQMGILGPMDIGASGLQGKMGTRKNKHQSKWVLGNWGKRAVWANGRLEQMGMWKLGKMDVWGIMGTLGQMGSLGSMSFGPSEHWEKMCTWGKWAPGKMSTRKMGKWAPGKMSTVPMGTVEQMGTLGSIDIGIYEANGHFRTDGHLGNTW